MLSARDPNHLQKHLPSGDPHSESPGPASPHFWEADLPPPRDPGKTETKSKSAAARAVLLPPLPCP